MKKVLCISLLLISFCRSMEQVKARHWPGFDWIAGFMTGGADASSFRHFLLLSNGTIESFAPGEKPELFPGIDHVVAISAGTFHMLVLKSDGTIWAWGRNDEKQLGSESLMKAGTNSTTPVQVTGINNAVAISAKGMNSYALLADGTVRAWGYGNLGMTGDGGKLTGSMTNANWSARGLPVMVQGITNAVAISGPMALLADGTVMTWGDGAYGRLGNGTDITSTIPVQVKGISNVVGIAYRENGALALLADGTVWAWGKNTKGQLGNGAVRINENDASNVPVKVQGITNAIAVDAHNVCLALLKDGSVKAWGWGAVGGMGYGRPGSNDVNAVPLKVPGVEHIIAVKSGNGYGFALQGDGTLVGWGANMVASGLYHQTWAPVKIMHIDVQ